MSNDKRPSARERALFSTPLSRGRDVKSRKRVADHTKKLQTKLSDDTERMTSHILIGDIIAFGGSECGGYRVTLSVCLI